jgi:protein TonB
MFEPVGSRMNAMRYFTSLLISLAAHAAIVCLLVVLPLFFFNVLHADELVTIVIEPPSPPVPPPPPSPPTRAVPMSKRVITYGPMEPVPKHIPLGIPLTDDAPVATAIEKIVQGLGDSGLRTDGRAIAAFVPVTEPPILPPPPPPNIHTPIRPGGNIQESKLIFKANPVYPELARRAHVSGAVVLEAIIDEEGKVSKLKVLSGNPLLIDAAVGAVKQWKYSPTVLNGEPVPVIATVTVIFRLR